MAATRRCSYLPQEIIFKVLLFVPVVSLIQCKLVCKLWRFIISSPQFIQTHLTISHEKQSSIMWVDTFPVPEYDDDEYPPCGYYYIKYFDDTREYTVELDLPTYFANIEIMMNPCLRIVGQGYIHTCNGLVCIGGGNADNIFLVNPATTQMKELPMCDNLSFDIMFLGFGFDPISNDYKLLRVVLAYMDFEVWAIENLVLEADLYSVNDGCWKKVEVPEPLRRCLPGDDSKCVHAKTGVFYMDCCDEILSFDLHNEVFGVLPIHKDEKLLKISNAFDFEGSLAMMFKDKIEEEGSVVSLWTLDDVPGKLCWTKKFNFEIAVNIDWVHLYMGVGQFVALNYDIGVILYDYKKKVTNKFSLLDAMDGEVVSIVKYTESLVSLEGFQPLNISGTFFVV